MFFLKSFHFKIHYVIYGIVFVMLVLTACNQESQTSFPPLTEEMLKNAQYKSEMSSEGIVKLVGGKYEEEIVPGAASKMIVVMIPDRYAFGDLNRDGVDDAVVVLATNMGGSGTFVSLAAVLNDEGAPEHVASADLGDRTKIISVSIEDDIVTVDVITHGPNDPMCCPSVHTTKRYKLEGNKLVELSD